MKILIYRDKTTNNIICIDKCPSYDKKVLENTIQEYNKTENSTVTVKTIKKQSLEEYLLNMYIQSDKKTNRVDTEECINALYNAIRRTKLLLDTYIDDYKNIIK